MKATRNHPIRSVRRFVPLPASGAIRQSVLAAYFAFAALANQAPAAAPDAFGTCLGNAGTSTVVLNELGSGGINLKVVRLSCKLSVVAPTYQADPDNYNWTQLDIDVLALKNAGFTPLVVVNDDNVPAWMEYGGLNVPDPAKFGTFFFQVLQHYYPASKGGIRKFEVHNEPDGTLSEITNVTQRADHYYNMLKECWDQSATWRSTHGVEIIGGVLSVTPFNQNGINAFFNELWGVKQAYNKMHKLSFHSYIRYQPNPPNGPRVYYPPEVSIPGGGNKGRLWDDRLSPTYNWLTANTPTNNTGVGYPPLCWVTECGYSIGSEAQSSVTGAIPTQAEQARWLIRTAVIGRGAHDSAGRYLTERFVEFDAYGGPDGDYGFKSAPGGAVRTSFSAYKTMCDVLDNSVETFTQINYDPAGICKYKFTKSNNYFGWVAWWAPEPDGGGTHTTTSAPVTGDVYTRAMTAATWTFKGTYNNQGVAQTLTNDPIYIEVRPHP